MALKAKTMRDIDPRHWDVALECQGKCVYCGLDGKKDIRILATFVLDHLIPRSAKGTDDADNRVLSCSRCNGDKGRFDPSKGVPKLTKKVLVKRAKQYIRTQRSDYLTELYKILNSK
jgi:5-methylcytosine-specific restriction endonuclease McrA